MKCILTDSNMFTLKGTERRFLHLATIQRGLREFIYFADLATSSAYIEELTGGTLSKIEDDELWDEIAQFIEENKIGHIQRQD